HDPDRLTGDVLHARPLGAQGEPAVPGHHDVRYRMGLGQPRGDSAPDYRALSRGRRELPHTADGYTNGTSEALIREYFAKQGGRDRVVIATKFSFNAFPGDPNAGGNGRKNIYRALAGSLKRLQTDYVDLYWLHAWDGVTPVEEVMHTLTDLVHEGKV